MAARILVHRGMKIEIWEKSFRIQGMVQPLHIGADMSDENIKELIDAVYGNVFLKAEHDAKMAVSARLKNHVNKLIFGEGSH